MLIDLTRDESIVLQSALQTIKQSITSKYMKNELEAIDSVINKISDAQDKYIASAIMGVV